MRVTFSYVKRELSLDKFLKGTSKYFLVVETFLNYCYTGNSGVNNVYVYNK